MTGVVQWELSSHLSLDHLSGSRQQPQKTTLELEQSSQRCYLWTFMLHLTAINRTTLCKSLKNGTATYSLRHMPESEMHDQA
ncbi:hypothetical protein UPYG_G00256740 [Umbra pygmaea]|uniref:Uncharacterized protein n=1 Tax=Umbra pygmaea TaxID=75934 RepID=A0ABD0WDG6_UMBPY